MLEATSCPRLFSAQASEDKKARASVTECFQHCRRSWDYKPARTSLSYLICRKKRKQTASQTEFLRVNAQAATD